MAEDISDLVVRARPEGLDEVTEGVSNMQDEFEETAESVGDQADEMDNFADQWAGAMGAIVAGLAVGVAGLLSQVPVLGEAFGGLASIIDALAFQIDQFLRPVLQPLTNLFYDISNAIFQLDGVLGDIVGAITSIAALIGGAIAALIPFKGVVGAITTVLGPLISAVTTVAGVLAGLNPIVLAIIGVVAGLIAAWVLFEDEIRAVVSFAIGKLEDLWGWFEDIGGWVVNGLEDAFSWLTDAIDDPLGAVEDVWDVLTDIGSWATNAIDEAFNWLKKALSDPLGTVEDIWNTLQNMVGETFETFLEIVMQLVDPVTGPAGKLERDVASFLDPRQGWEFTGFSSGGMVEETGPAMVHENEAVLPADLVDSLRNQGSTPATGEQIISLDGKRMTEDTGRYRYGETANRGRFG